MLVTVRDNNIDQALRVLKKKMQREGVFREMKNRRAYEKPSERRAREEAESTRRVRKLMRKKSEKNLKTEALAAEAEKQRKAEEAKKKKAEAARKRREAAKKKKAKEDNKASE